MTTDHETYTRADLIRLTTETANLCVLVEDFDGYDPWGSTMGIWFDVADILYYREDDIPAEWEFKPGIGRMGEDDLNPILNDHTSEYLRLIGNRCNKLADVLKMFSLDY